MDTLWEHWLVFRDFLTLQLTWVKRFLITPPRKESGTSLPLVAAVSFHEPSIPHAIFTSVLFVVWSVKTVTNLNGWRLFRTDGSETSLGL